MYRQINRGRYYKTVVELANELGIGAYAVAVYKNRHGCTGVIDTLQAMQLEIKERYILNGEIKTYKELIGMGYTSSNYKNVPKERVPVYPKLQGLDFVNGCVDVMKIYEEVKQEISTIAGDLSLSASTVKRAIGDLEKNGFIRKKQRWRDNGGKSSLLFEIIK